MKRSRRRKIVFLAFALVAVAVIVGTLVPGAGRWLPFYAPLATHVGAFALVGLLARLTVPDSRWAMPVALVLAAGLGIALETLQLVVPKRTFAVPDLFANVAGSVSGVLLAAFVLAMLERRGRDGKSDVQATEPN